MSRVTSTNKDFKHYFLSIYFHNILKIYFSPNNLFYYSLCNISITEKEVLKMYLEAYFTVNEGGFHYKICDPVYLFVLLDMLDDKLETYLT